MRIFVYTYKTRCMRKNFNSLITFLPLFIVLFTTQVKSQTFSSHTYNVGCYSVDSTWFGITGCAPSGDSVVEFYGDGISDTIPIYCSGGSGMASNISTHTYSSPGMYTLKFLILASGVAVDSVIVSQRISCSEARCIVYEDVNANCIFDSGDAYLYSEPTTLEVDSAGVPLDTIITTCGFSYYVLGPTGSIYSYKVIKSPYGYSISCPGDTVVYDTIGVTVKEPSIGFVCNPADSFDLAVSANFSAGLTGAGSHIFITSSSCNVVHGVTLTIDYSPKYVFSYIWTGGGSSYPYTVSGNSVTFTIGDVSANSLVHFVPIFNPVGTLTLGDTVHAKFRLTPFIGDADTSNNIIISCDTIHASHDPNYKSVMPDGNIDPGTLLKYIITFENTGNDTAFNIHIMDTLSDNLDISTLKVFSATAPMDLIFLKSGGHNIVKFDFPNINLLDTAQHHDFDGMVTYTIQAKNGLAPGTKIDNKAGIYFDDNSVVMTNNVENVIGYPTVTPSINQLRSIRVYPNPAKNNLNVEGAQGASLAIYNVLGEEVQLLHCQKNIEAADISDLAGGVYILQILSSSGERKNIRFVKE